MQDTVTSARTKLAVHHAFFGSILLNSRFEPREGYKTYGATNGCDLIIYNPDLCKSLNVSQLMFFLLHEVMHIAYMHMGRQRGRDKEAWDIATDIVINLLILDMGYERPPGVLYEPQFRGMSAEEVYGKIAEDASLKQEMKNKQKGSRKGPSGSSPGKGEKKGEDKGKEKGNNPAPGSSGDQKEDGKDGEGSGPAGKKEDGEDNGGGGCEGEEETGYEGMDEHLPFPSGADGAEKVKRVIAKAYEVHKASRNRGELPGGLEIFIKDLLESKVPWQREVHKFAGTVLAKEDYSLLPPNRRHLIDDIYLPSLRSQKIGEVVLNIDSSGSTYFILKQFAAEAKSIFREVDEVTIIVSDSKIQQVVKSKDVAAFLKKLEFKGGGGTDHRPVFEYLRNNRIIPELYIGLTDGGSAFPVKPPSYPVLWCLTPNHNKPPWGKHVVIK